MSAGFLVFTLHLKRDAEPDFREAVWSLERSRERVLIIVRVDIVDLGLML